jgi:general secretion pathway protein H
MKRARGLSLIELLVVIVLIAAASGIAAMALTSGMPGQQLRNGARQVAAELRFTRAQAIVSGRSQQFQLNAATREWSAAGRHKGQLPAEIAVVATTARQEQPADGIAVVRFFPDGSATGGRIVLQRGEAAWRIDVGWLTGDVSLARGDGQ